MARNERQDYLDTSNNYATGINDLQFEKDIKKQKLKEKQDQIAFEKYEKKEARKEKIQQYKANSTPIYKIKKSILLTMLISIILALIALLNGFISEFVLTTISVILTLVIGKSIRVDANIHQPKLTNILLYNLSKSIRDFIDYKIPYEIFENRKKWFDMYTILSMIAVMFLKTDNILYGFFILCVVLLSIVSFAENEIEDINSHLSLIIYAAIVGTVIKVIIEYIYMGIIDIPLMNILLINCFSIITAYTENLKIDKPN